MWPPSWQPIKFALICTIFLILFSPNIWSLWMIFSPFNICSEPWQCPSFFTSFLVFGFLFYSWSSFWVEQIGFLIWKCILDPENIITSTLLTIVCSIPTLLYSMIFWLHLGRIPYFEVHYGLWKQPLHIIATLKLFIKFPPLLLDFLAILWPLQHHGNTEH